MLRITWAVLLIGIIIATTTTAEDIKGEYCGELHYCLGGYHCCDIENCCPNTSACCMKDSVMKCSDICGKNTYCRGGSHCCDCDHCCPNNLHCCWKGLTMACCEKPQPHFYRGREYLCPNP